MPDNSYIPHNPDAERAVIGAVLINPDCFIDVAEVIKDPSYFYIHRNGFLWDAIASLTERKVPVDILTVQSELSRTGRLEDVGGPAYLTGLVNDTPSSMNAVAYARFLHTAKVRRDIVAAANKVAALAYNEELDPEALVAQSIGVVTDAASGVASDGIRSARDVVSDVYDEVDRLSMLPANRLPGVPTGLYDLDRLLGGGLQKGRMYTVGGRPGTGKTSLLLSIVKHATLDKRNRGILFTLEMSDTENIQRLLSISSEIDSQRIQTGKIDDSEWPLFTHGVEVWADAPLMIDDTPAITPTQVLAKCKRISATVGLDYIVIDYLGLMESGRRFENRNQEVSYISRATKGLARELNVPVLIAQQLNRAVDSRVDQRPVMSDLRDSGSIEQDSDGIIFISRDSTPNGAILDLAKQRNGPTGIVNAIFQSQYTRFVSVARRSDDNDYLDD